MSSSEKNIVKPLTAEFAQTLWRTHGEINYLSYQAWYEGKGRQNTEEGNFISLLRCRGCFRTFGREYSVIRVLDYNGVKRRNKAEYDNMLDAHLSRLRELFGNDPKQIDLDGIVEALFLPKMGHPRVTRHRAPSLVSKIGAFLYPDEIVPFDSYGFAGAKKLAKSTIHFQHEKGDLTDCRLAWFQKCCRDFRKKHKHEINQAHLSLQSDSERFLPLPVKPVFSNRIVDLYLMSVGARFQTRPFEHVCL